MDKDLKGVPVEGEKISRARLNKPASQNEVAVAVGVQRETVSVWEQPGVKGIRASHFRKLIEFLDVKPEEIRASSNGDDAALSIVAFALRHNIPPGAITRASKLVAQAAKQSEPARAKVEKKKRGGK
jgi:DNA-binding Xre family transcriptional regulator